MSFDAAGFYNGFWNQACRVVSEMEKAGCYFDVERCRAAASRAAVDAQELLSRWEAVAPGVNPESPPQLVQLLYEQRGFPIPPIKGTLKAVQRTKKDEKPTGEASLDWLLRKAQKPENKELLSVLMALRRTTKLAQFLEKLPSFVADGFLYASFGPDTGTGRLSSRNPNLQNIPGAKNDKYGIRSCFTAPAGHRLLVADYSALEPRILAAWLVLLFGDRSLVEAILAGDVYGAIAKQTWPNKLQHVAANCMKGHKSPEVVKLRDTAKIILLASVYGKGVPGLAMQLNVSVEEAQALFDDYFRAYPGIKAFQQAALKEAQDSGRVLSLIGQYRQIDNANSPREYEQARAARQATNTKCQMSAAGVVYAAMLKQEGRGGILQMQIHDELVWRLREDEDPEPLVAAMEHPFKTELPVPLDVEWKLCDSWDQGK